MKILIAGFLLFICGCSHNIESNDASKTDTGKFIMVQRGNNGFTTYRLIEIEHNGKKHLVMTASDTTGVAITQLNSEATK